MQQRIAILSVVLPTVLAVACAQPMPAAEASAASAELTSAAEPQLLAHAVDTALRAIAEGNDLPVDEARLAAIVELLRAGKVAEALIPAKLEPPYDTTTMPLAVRPLGILDEFSRYDDPRWAEANRRRHMQQQDAHILERYLRRHVPAVLRTYARATDLPIFNLSAPWKLLSLTEDSNAPLKALRAMAAVHLINEPLASDLIVATTRAARPGEPDGLPLFLDAWGFLEQVTMPLEERSRLIRAVAFALIPEGNINVRQLMNELNRRDPANLREVYSDWMAPRIGGLPHR